MNPPPYEECVLGSGVLEVDAGSDPDNRYGDASFTPVYTMARGARLDYSFANFDNWSADDDWELDSWSDWEVVGATASDK